MPQKKFKITQKTTKKKKGKFTLKTLSVISVYTAGVILFALGFALLFIKLGFALGERNKVTPPKFISAPSDSSYFTPEATPEMLATNKAPSTFQEVVSLNCATSQGIESGRTKVIGIETLPLKTNLVKLNSELHEENLEYFDCATESDKFNRFVSYKEIFIHDQHSDTSGYLVNNPELMDYSTTLDSKISIYIREDKTGEGSYQVVFRGQKEIPISAEESITITVDIVAMPYGDIRLEELVYTSHKTGENLGILIDNAYFSPVNGNTPEGHALKKLRNVLSAFEPLPTN